MKKQNGNVLVFILVAIALIGLLTAMLSRPSGESSDTGRFEQNQISASRLIRDAKAIETGVQNLLARGCSENEITFWHDSNNDDEEDVDDDYFNPRSPGDRSCHLFASQGMGLAYEGPSDNALQRDLSAWARYGEWFFGGSSYIYEVARGKPGEESDPANKELIAFVPYLDETICQQVNRLAGIENDNNGLPPQDDTAGFVADLDVPYLGNFAGGHRIDSAASGSGEMLDGKTTGCVQGRLDNSGGSEPVYIFYHVLKAR
jgi:type II secretory pathway pseudopilin PulG